MFTESLLAYDDDGNVIGTLDYVVQRRPDGTKRLVDLARMEERGAELDIEQPGGVWHVEGAAGSKVWPERLTRAHDFRVEKEGAPGRRRLAALVHKRSGHRRERAAIEAALEERLAEATAAAGGELRLSLDQYLELVADIVGRPDRPLRIDDEGRTLGDPVPRGKPQLP